jgi:hypothetical protein
MDGTRVSLPGSTRKPVENEETGQHKYRDAGIPKPYKAGKRNCARIERESEYTDEKKN